jgi:fluoroquinolone transport system ATP-binding protein
MQVADVLCDRVAFIVDGSIPLIDAPRELKIKHGRREVRVEYQANGHKDERDFPLDGLGDREDFITLLREAHIETIHTQETTLENIFIEVTGRELA